MIVAKNRNGRTGKVDLVFMKNYTRFENSSPISTDDIPTYDKE
jgi:replicative DNA helicase